MSLKWLGRYMRILMITLTLSFNYYSKIEYETERDDVRICMLSHHCGWGVVHSRRYLPNWISSAVHCIFQSVHWTSLDPCNISVTCNNHSDLNINLQKRDDVDAVRLIEVLSSFDLLQHVSSPTHDRGGLFDVIIVSGTHPSEGLSIDEVGLFDHMLLSWSANLSPLLQSTPRQRGGDGGTLTLPHLFLGWRILNYVAWVNSNLILIRWRFVTTQSSPGC